MSTITQSKNNSFRKDPSKIFSAVILSYLIMATIGMATTNDASRIFISVFRIFSIICILASLFYILIAGLIKFQNLFLVLITYSIFIIVGILLSLFNVGYVEYFEIKSLNLLVILIGSIIFAIHANNSNDSYLINIFISYVYVVFIATILSGGFVLEIPPRFDLEFMSDIYREESYSLGLSQFYGFGAIFASFASIKSNSKLGFLFYFFTFFLFGVLSVLGGGRGDTIIALGISSLFFLRTFPLQSIIIIALALIYILFTDLWFILLDGFVFFQRLAEFEDGLSGRGELLSQSLDLINERPHCLLLGCGFDYFQSFYGYDIGLYPHNVVAEYLITLGIFSSFFIFIAVSIGVFKEYKRNSKLTIYFLILLYAFLISLKSQSILNSWMLTPLIIYYVSISFDRTKLTERN